MKRINTIFFTAIFIILVTNISLAGSIFNVNLIYEVDQGDALITIAQKFDVSVDDIRKANDLGENQHIRVGDELLIPKEYQRKEEVPDELYSLYEAEENRNTFSLSEGKSYRVKIPEVDKGRNIDVSNMQTLDYKITIGDNLYDLAREFNTNIAVIRKLNDLDRSDVIRLGDNIKLPIDNISERELLSHTITDEEFELLARIIHGEARGEPYIGQVAVGAVVLNRVLGNYFPNDIESVIYQSGQFSPVMDGQIYLDPDRSAYQAAEEALAGKDPTRGAEYFYNPDTANHIQWFEQRQKVVRIGNHVFTR